MRRDPTRSLSGRWQSRPAMRSVKTSAAVLVSLALFALASLPAFAQRFRHDRGPKALLFRSMTRARHLNVSAVMTQRMFHSRGLELELKVEQDQSGRVKLTTIYPPVFQGMVSLDDGTVWKTYIPKER